MVKPTSPECSQKHPGRAYRTQSLLKAGDAKMAWKAGGHAVLYATERYSLKDLIKDSEVKPAQDKMYNFLKWKLGSPAAVAGQWLSGGYEHFDGGYVDEGAAFLLGILDVGQGKPEIKVPKALLDYLRAQVGASSEAISAYLESNGVPAPLAAALGAKTEKVLKNLLENNKAGVFFPKSFDVENKLVELAIRARRIRPGDLVKAAGARRPVPVS